MSDSEQRPLCLTSLQQDVGSFPQTPFPRSLLSPSFQERVLLKSGHLLNLGRHRALSVEAAWLGNGKQALEVRWWLSLHRTGEG